MELYVYDRELKLLGIIDNYNSFRTVRKYHDVGGFELHTNITEENLVLLRKGNIINEKGSNDAFFIEYRGLVENKDGSESLEAQGSHLTGYLSKRIIWGRTYIADGVEDVMRTLVYENVINPDNPNRKIPLLDLGPKSGFNSKIRFQSSFQNVRKKLTDISIAYNIGYKLALSEDKSRIEFITYRGTDRSVKQDKVAPVIFSKEYENILGTTFTESEFDFANSAIIAGEGEGEDRVITSIEQGQGLDRAEIYVDARDLSREVNDEEIPIDHYKELLKDRGFTKLEEHIRIESFESDINIYRNNRYNKDFFLGDLVTFRSKKWGIYVNTRVTEVEEVFEESGRKINVTFGDAVPTIIDKIQNLKEE